MAVYFVIGALLVAWALVLTFGGMARVDKGPDKRTGRTLMAVSGILCIAAFAALMATTKKEHPREEAAEKAAEEGRKPGGEEPPAGRGEPPSLRVEVIEDEYSIELPAGKTLEEGILTFDVANKGRIPHDLAIEGSGREDKTPLIDAGKTARLETEVVPGDYRLYCSVPGHEQLGMKTEVTVR